ncbi:MAG: hypothetical protein U0271_41095 [Polyangiaceae bacterium]
MTRLLLVLTVFTISGCSCPDDSAAPSEICDSLTRTINDARASCGLEPLAEDLVCGASVCDTGLSCEPRADLEECRAAISTLSCSALEDSPATDLVSCLPLFDAMEQSCGDDDDDLDDDWD